MNNKIFLILTICFALAGCESTATKTDTETSTEDRGSSVDSRSGAGSSAETFGVDSRSTTGMNALEDPAHPLYSCLSERVIYFDYDQSNIQQQYRASIECHATYLSEHPNVVMTLEGHADERGSREYNLALGERRSIAVERQMALLGASASQIRTVSYGEERPIAQNHDESSWGLNRRVEVLY